MGSTMASFLSAVSLMGGNTEVYTYGIEYGIMFFAYCIAFPIAAEVYTPVFYKLGVCSAHEYLELRFNKYVRWAVTCVYVFQMVIYIAVVLYAPSLALSRATGWYFWISLVVTGAVATFYTAMGGIKAVVWTDLVQVIVMIVGFILLVAFGAAAVGGPTEAWRIAGEGMRLDLFNFDLNPFVRHSFWALCFGGAGMVLSIYATNQTQVQRYLACKDLKTARIALNANLPLNAAFLVLQLAAGVVAYAYFVGCDPLMSGAIDASDQLLPHLIMTVFSEIPVLRGLFISSLFAAALSTISSGVNSVAGVLLEDVIFEMHLKFRKGHRISQKRMTLLARLLAVVLGGVTIGLGFVLQLLPQGVLQMVFSIFGAIGGPILTAFTLGIIFPYVNEWGGLVGFTCSLIAGLWMAFGSIFHATYKQIQEVPLTIEYCPNVTRMLTSLTNSRTQTPPVEWTFYNLSYLYYSPLCLLVGIVTATIVSALTGFSSKKPVSHSLLAWQAVKLYSWLPNCGKPQTTPLPLTSLHYKKINQLVADPNNSNESLAEDDAEILEIEEEVGNDVKL